MFNHKTVWVPQISTSVREKSPHTAATPVLYAGILWEAMSVNVKKALRVMDSSVLVREPDLLCYIVICCVFCCVSDIDECARGNSNCDTEHARCTNSHGSYHCTCLSGYSGDGVNCNGKFITCRRYCSWLLCVSVSIRTMYMPVFIHKLIQQCMLVQLHKPCS